MQIDDRRREFKVPIGDFELDINRLPSFTRKALIALTEIMPEIPKEALLLELLIKMAQVGSIPRLWLRLDNEDNPINIYGMLFMPSGDGKDKPLGIIDSTLMADAFTEFSKRSEQYKKDIEEANHHQCVISGLAVGSSGYRAYIQEHRPRSLVYEISNGTPEGMTALRVAFKQAGWGGTFIKIGEFADYVLSNNETWLDFMTYTKELFDKGNSSPKITKGDKTTEAVTGVVSNVLYHSAISGLQEEAGRERLLGFLNRGLARRSFFCYPDTDAVKISDPNEIRRIMKERVIMRERGSNYLNNEGRSHVREFLRKNVGFVPYELTKEGRELYDLYKTYSQNLVLPETMHPAVSSEHKNRDWKAVKLAGLIAAWEHSDTQEITSEDLLHAIYLTEYFGQHFEKLIRNPVKDEIEVLLYKFIENKDRWINTSEIRGWDIVSRNNFSNWFRSIKEELATTALNKGFDLEELKYGRSGKQYKLTKIQSPETITLSVNNDDEPQLSTNYTQTTTTFEQIEQVVFNNKAYSAASFVDNYRKDDNVIPGQDLIILDVDSGWTITEALDFLDSYNLKAKIITTKSHQRLKNGITCDRFRIFLPTKGKIMLNKTEFAAMMKNVFSFFKNKPDPSCKNISRLYFGHKGEVFVSRGQNNFDHTSWISAPPPKREEFRGNPGGEVSFEEIKRRTNYAQEFREGNRNNYLARVLLWFRDDWKWMDKSRIRETIRALNNGSLPEQEIETMFRAHL